MTRKNPDLSPFDTFLLDKVLQTIQVYPDLTFNLLVILSYDTFGSNLVIIIILG